MKKIYQKNKSQYYRLITYSLNILEIASLDKYVNTKILINIVLYFDKYVNTFNKIYVKYN